MRHTKRARQDSGFALLLIFLLAAVIAINLYMEIPRVAEEAQRQQEQLLIARGEEYKRAILVFYKTNNRWPARIEELENTNNRRYLRRRFIDPMTGKDEWRLIHIANGIFTDSLVNKPKSPMGDQQASINTAGQYVGMAGGMFDASAGTTAPAGPNLGRRRASDGGPGGGIIVPMDPSSGTSASNGNATASPPENPLPGAPGSAGTGAEGAAGNSGGTGTTGVTSGDGSQPGSQLPPGVTPGLPGTPGMPPGFPGVPPGLPGVPPGFSGVSGGMPGIPGNPVNSQTGGVSPTTYSTAPGANGMPPGFPQPGMSAFGANGQAPNAAANMIQQILQSPRPGGAPVGTGTLSGGLVIGSGIAGVASKADAEGIMVYKDQTNYKKWEFIFDPTKWKPPANPLTGPAAGGTPASQMGNLQQTQIGTSVNDIVAQQNGTAASGASGATGSTGTTGSTGPIIH